MRKSIAQTALRALILVGFVAGGTRLAVAHHSYSAFDMNNQKVVSGTVKKMDWSNPHSWIWLDVANEQGVVETWGIEGMSPNYLARRGWTRTTLKPGDKLSVTLHPMRNGEKGGSFMSAKRADGSSVGMTGPITEP
jgi:hypothetical protein